MAGLPGRADDRVPKKRGPLMSSTSRPDPQFTGPAGCIRALKCRRSLPGGAPPKRHSSGASRPLLQALAVAAVLAFSYSAGQAQPSPPTNLAATVSGTLVSLTWEHNTNDADGFIVAVVDPWWNVWIV